jgi:N-methylhydantoinase B
VNRVRIERADGTVYVPAHCSKDQDIEIAAGDVIAVSTPGGGGFGAPEERLAEARAEDLARGYYSADELERLYGPR